MTAPELGKNLLFAGFGLSQKIVIAQMLHIENSVLASFIACRKRFKSGCPTVRPMRESTSSKGTEEIMLIRSIPFVLHFIATSIALSTNPFLLNSRGPIST